MAKIEALNAICPYYTMYPLAFPLRVLRRNARDGGYIVDPFCGRGTTSFAARLLGLPSVGIDSSPIAVAIAQAKIARVSESQVIASARRILEYPPRDVELPTGEFWGWCYHPSTLADLCKFRSAFLHDCRSGTRKVLRAILLGALHGPLTKQQPSHLSNQSPRTFAPKPKYAIGFWKKRKMKPPKVDTFSVITVRAARYLRSQPRRVPSEITLGDSRNPSVYGDHEFSCVVTSPPYYGMRTYIPDQWIRSWFLGEASEVIYSPHEDELSHGSQDEFASQLSVVWSNLAVRCVPNANMIIRFGGINDRRSQPLELIKQSLMHTDWRIKTVRAAGDSDRGRRQARQFGQECKNPMPEYDVYAALN